MLIKKDLVRSKIDLQNWISAFFKRNSNHLLNDIIDLAKSNKKVTQNQINTIKEFHQNEFQKGLDQKLNQEFASLLTRIDDVKEQNFDKIKFEMKGTIITFNSVQSFYLKKIFEKLPFIDVNRFLTKCGLLKIRNGNKSFTRTIKSYYQNKLKYVPNLNLD